MSRVFQPHVITDDSALGGQFVEGSLRFDGSNDHFIRTPSAEGNRRRFTISLWTKRSKTGSYQAFIGPYADNTNRDTFRIDDNDRLEFQSTGNSANAKTSARFRDTKSWYHFMVVADATRPSTTDRVKFYVNGELQSQSENNYSSSNIQFKYNDNVAHYVGSRGISGNYDLPYNGYLSQYYFVDGAALVPSDFGYTDARTGNWRPKKFNTNVNNNYTYGTSTSTSPSGTWTASGNGWGSNPPSHIFDDNYSNFMNNNAGGQIITWNTTSYNLSGKLEIECYGDPYDIYVNGNSTKVADAPSGSNYFIVDCGTHDQINEIQFAGTTYNTGTGLGSAGIYVRGIYVNGIQLKNGATNDFGKNGFYLPMDGTSEPATDMSGNHNDFLPVNMSTFVGLDKAKKYGGALPIHDTDAGGRQILGGYNTFREDPYKANIVLALPLADDTNDKHSYIKGSGSPRTISNPNGVYRAFDGSNLTAPSPFYTSAHKFEAGSSRRLQTAASSDFVFDGDFCIEFYIKMDSSSGENPTLSWGNGAYKTLFFSGNQWILEYPSTGITLGGGYENGRWHHYALTRSGSTIRWFRDGHLISSHNVSSTIGTEETLYIGHKGNSNTYLSAAMLDFRMYKGVAKYTAPFVAPALFSDVVNDSPTSMAYATKARRDIATEDGFGSVSGNGETGSAMKTSANSGFTLGTNDYTVELWFYATDLGNTNMYRALIADEIYGGSNGWCIYSRNDFIWVFVSGSNHIASGSGTLKRHRWNHIVWERTGTGSNNCKLYINGAQVGQATMNNNLSGNEIVIGGNTGGNQGTTYYYGQNGFISNVRVVVGSNVYGGAYTVPNAPLTNVTNTKLLCCQSPVNPVAMKVHPSGTNLTLQGPATNFAGARATHFNPFKDTSSFSGHTSGYATLNFNEASDRNNGTLEQGALRVDGNNYMHFKSDIRFGPDGLKTGKYYWEISFKDGNNTSAPYCGITGNFEQDGGEIAGGTDKAWFNHLYFSRYTQGGSTALSNEGDYKGFQDGDTFGFAVDLDARIFYGYRHGSLTFVDTTIPDANTTPFAPFVFSTNDGSSGGLWSDTTFNFGQRPFKHIVPEGFSPIATNNYQPGILRAQKHFDSIVYTPNSGGLTVTGLEFKPDLLWFKSRAQAYHNYIFDICRGTGAVSLRPSDTTPEPASGDATAVNEFIPGGFYLAGASGINDNGSGTNGVVAWAWKGGSPITSSGGGVRFDGANGTNLRIANSADIQIGSTSNWTIEFWLKRTGSYSDYDVIIGKGASGTYEWFIEGFADGSVDFLYSNNGSTTWSGQHEIISSQALERWYHIAIVRNGSGANNFKMYVDGTQTFQTTAFDIYAGTYGLDIGGYGGATGQDPPVVISNLRIVKGTSVYTSNFTPPTSPLTNITNTKLLCCQAIRSATEAAVTPNSITSNGGCHATSLNPFDAFSKDGVGYMSASAAGITNGTQPLTGASINTKAGFSIVTYCGNADGNSTFGHGLDQAPEIFFLKSRDNTEEWRVYYTIADGSYDFMYLNATNSVMHSGYALPTATLINKADDANERMVAYCWHSVPGYSAFGSYIANGSSDGTFVETGFKPAFVLIKRHTDGANYWEIRDNKRDPYNPMTERLFPNRNDTTSDGEGFDMISNGFKIRNNGSGSNYDGKRYIYMAFAERPFVSPFGAQTNAK